MVLLFTLCSLFICVVCASSTFYDHVVNDASGNEVNLAKYRGKVTLVVNVASHCAYTENTYRALTRLHDILAYEGYFSVLAFPCNQFGEQEPASASHVVEAMKEMFDVEFPIFDKIDVIGESASPVFRNLIEQSSVVPDWNFYKYLVDHNGRVLHAWGTRITVEEIFDIIQEAISNAKEANRIKQGQDGINSPEADTGSKDEL